MTRLIDADALTEVLETMAKDKWNQQVGSSSYGKTPFCMYCGAEMRKEDRKNECL